MRSQTARESAEVGPGGFRMRHHRTVTRRPVHAPSLRCPFTLLLFNQKGLFLALDIKRKKRMGPERGREDKKTGRKVRREKGDEREKNERETFVPYKPASWT